MKMLSRIRRPHYNGYHQKVQQKKSMKRRMMATTTRRMTLRWGSDCQVNSCCKLWMLMHHDHWSESVFLYQESLHCLKNGVLSFKDRKLLLHVYIILMCRNECECINIQSMYMCVFFGNKWHLCQVNIINYGRRTRLGIILNFIQCNCSTLKESLSAKIIVLSALQI